MWPKKNIRSVNAKQSDSCNAEKNARLINAKTLQHK